MNGQTGRMVGDLPVSLFRMMAVLIPLFLGILFVGLLVMAAIDAEMPAALFAYLIVPVFVCVFVGILLYSGMKSVEKAESASKYMTGSLKLTGSHEEVVGIAGAKKFIKETKNQKKTST